jgi:hypothetical protein
LSVYTHGDEQGERKRLFLQDDKKSIRADIWVLTAVIMKFTALWDMKHVFWKKLRTFMRNELSFSSGWKSEEKFWKFLRMNSLSCQQYVAYRGRAFSAHYV